MKIGDRVEVCNLWCGTISKVEHYRDPTKNMRPYRAFGITLDHLVSLSNCGLYCWVGENIKDLQPLRKYGRKEIVVDRSVEWGGN